MNAQWGKVMIGAIFEVLWVIGLKHAEHPLAWAGTIVAIVISFYMLISAGKHLPGGTVYAVFVGLGTAGTVIVDMALFGDPFRWSKLLLILLLLAGVIGLTVSEETGGSREEGADA